MQKSTMNTRARATYGCLRILLSADIIHRIRMTENSNRNVPSRPARVPWKVLASVRIGRNKTVMNATGRWRQFVAAEGTKLEPPVYVLASRLFNVEFKLVGWEIPDSL